MQQKEKNPINLVEQIRDNYINAKNRVRAWWQKVMSKEDDGLVGKVIVGAAAVGLFLWIFYEIAKAGVKGNDVTLNRCGNCNMVLKPQQTPCPNCGFTVVWK